MKCSFCNKNIGSECFKNSYLIHCKHCRSIFHTAFKSNVKIVSHSSLNYIDKKLNNLPEFQLNDLILCIDPIHELFLEYGEVIKSEDLFSKVKFKKITLWMPKQIIEKVPEEWK